MKTFCRLCCLSVLQETVQKSAELLGRRVTRLLWEVARQTDLSPQHREPRCQTEAEREEHDWPQKLQHSKKKTLSNKTFHVTIVAIRDD